MHVAPFVPPEPMSAFGPTQSRHTPISLVSLQQRLAALELENTRLRDGDRDLVEPLACAATLATFDPRELLAAFGMATDATNLERLRIHADDTRRNGLDAARWRLTQAARRRALTVVGEPTRLRELRWRVRIPAPASLQRMADLLLEGATPPPTLAIGELAALVEAHAWYAGVLPWLPPADLLRRRLAMAELLEPMQRLIGDHFVGRKHELNRLTDYVGILKSDGMVGALGVSVRRFVRRARRSLLSDPPLFVVGPGGVGKSSLMARFILDHVDLAGDAPLPFVLVDFDRAQVEPTLPLSLLLAALQQLRVQFPAHADAMVRMSESLTQHMRARDEEEYTKSYSLQESVVMDFAKQVDTMLGGRDESTPLLWVLDTFEEPQRMGESTVGPLWELMDTLQRHLPRLRLVVCGRVAPPSFHWDLVPLDEFDQPSALAYLRQRLSQIGAADRADETTLVRVISMVGRSPLVLRLAARLIAEADPQLLMRKMRGERILAFLFHRVLEHIRVHEQLDAEERVDKAERAKLQDELARLVFPGLAVRRITPGVIRHVLAKPCGVELRDAGHAERLFKALRQQVDIVEPGDDEDDEPSLLHRSDLRRMMLRDLEARAGTRTLERIARRAVRHHQSIGTPSHRAEEIYHRLRLVQTESTIRARWQPEVQPYLLGALDEMERPSMRNLLADLLGVTLDAQTLKNAAQEDWERQTERRAAEYLRAGSPTRAIQSLQERPQRLVASPLLGLEAQAWHLLGDFERAAALAQRAFDECIESGDTTAACYAALLLALAEEADGALEAAHAHATEALELARPLGDQILLLRVDVTLLRLGRRLGSPDEELAALVQQLNALLEADTMRGLRRRPALLRELLAEIGERNQRLLRIGIDVLGVDLPSIDAADELGLTLEIWAAQAPKMAAEAAHSFSVAPERAALPPTRSEWSAWLWESGSDRTSQLLLTLMRTVPPESRVLAGLAHLYRREVERRIVRAEADRAL
jgi:tetratricopeptide (TPR) repeat protein